MSWNRRIRSGPIRMIEKCFRHSRCNGLFLQQWQRSTGDVREFHCQRYRGGMPIHLRIIHWKALFRCQMLSVQFRRFLKRGDLFRGGFLRGLANQSVIDRKLSRWKSLGR